MRSARRSLLQRRQIGLLAPFRRADVIGDMPLFEKIEDVRPAIHAARLERALLLGEIEQRDVSERNVVEIEVAAKLQLRL